jgi:hypothetical protein
MADTETNDAGFRWFALGFVFGASVLVGLFWILIIEPVPLTKFIMKAQVSEDSARDEAYALFDTVRDHVSSQQERSESRTVRLTGTTQGVGLSRDDIQGDYYVLADVVIELEDGRSRLVAVPRNGFYPVLHCDFRDADDFEITIAQPAGVESMRD